MGVKVAVKETIVKHHEVELSDYEVHNLNETGMKVNAIKHARTGETNLSHGIRASSKTVQGDRTFDARVIEEDSW